MRRKISLVLGITTCLILTSSVLTFSQDTPGATPEVQVEPDIQWVWGEVISVDAQKNEFLVKYLDYETEQEKEIKVAVDDKTTYENIKSLVEIKQNDTVSIDYIVSPEGKNIAKNISVEKPESPEAVGTEAPSIETVPEDLQPSSTTE